MDKKVAITLLIIALVFIGLAIVGSFVQLNTENSTQQVQNSLDDSGNGKIGVVILPPQIEDKGNGE